MRPAIRNLTNQGYCWKIVGGRTGTPNILAPNSGVIGNGTATQYQSNLYFPLWAASQVKMLMFEFGNYYNNTAVTAVDAHPLDRTLRVGLQDSRGKITSLSFQSSGTTSVLQASADAVNGVTDLTVPIPYSGDAGNPIINIREFATYASVPVAWPASTTGEVRGGEGVEFGTALTDKTKPGSVNVSGAGNGRGFTTLLAIYGWVPKSLKIPCVIHTGDSIGETGNVDAVHNGWVGWPNRLLGPYCPFVHIGASGQGIFSIWQSSTERQRHVNFLVNKPWNYSDYILLSSTVGNDVKNGQTQALYKGSCDRLNALFARYRPRHIVCSGPPLTDPTNTIEQPAFPGSWALTTAIGDWAITDPYLSGFIDTRGYMADPTNNPLLLWKNDVTFTPIPADGTHPGPPYHDAVVNGEIGNLPWRIGIVPT